MKNNQGYKPPYSLTFRIILLVFFSLLLSALFTVMTMLVVRWAGLKIPSASITLTIILAFVLACAVGTTSATFLSKQLSREHEQFSRAITEVSNGNFDVKFPDSPDRFYGQIGSELNKMVKDLKSVNVMRNDFVSNFSHELKTPITSINGFAELLMGDVTEEERKEYAQIIYGESARLLTLAKNTLLLSKLEGVGIYNKRTFALDELVENCLVLFTGDFEKKKINLSSDLRSIPYFWDDSLLGQAIINLISNAVKYTNEGGNIRVELYQDDDLVHFVVKDDGCGMSESTLKRIFERYYQGDGSHKTEGNGLGLSIVKKIAFLCGGDIKAESVYGKGSTFTMTLPVKKPPLSPSIK